MPNTLYTLDQTFPNNNFEAYIEQIYKIQFPDGNPHFLVKLFKVLPALIWAILKDAFIELFLLAIFALVIMKMSQGRDLIVGFFEPGGLYGFGRVALTILSLLGYSIAMWIIPAAIFAFTNINYNRESVKAKGNKFFTHLFFTHRILPLLPFWFFSAALFKESYIHLLIFYAAVLELIAIGFLFRKETRTNIRRGIIWIAGLIALALFIYLCFWPESHYTIKKLALTGFLFLLSFLIFALYFNLDINTLRSVIEPTSPKPFKQFKKNTIIYGSVFFLIAVTMVLNIFSFDLSAIAPESIILFAFTFYVFFIDFFHYLAGLNNSVRLAFTYAGLAVVLAFIISDKLPNVSHYDMNLLPDKKITIKDELPEFQSYYDEWKKRILERKDTSIPYPIILVSGEGGGSRAGLWLSQSLMNFEGLTDGKFREHIFSMSTVSGSTVGAGAMMSYWAFLEEQNIKYENKWKKFPEYIFRQNFIGNNLHGLLTTDFLKQFLPFPNWKSSSRNNRLQEQESTSVQIALDSIYLDKGPRTFTVFDKMFTKKSQTAQRYMDRDFLSFYYTKENDTTVLKKKLPPLFFINTARSMDSRRGIFAPVRLDSSRFLDALDVTSFIYKKEFPNQGRMIKAADSAISLGAAVNTSELFPFFSAPAYIENLGSFVDGGYHENSGLKTTYEIFKLLKDCLENDTALKKNDYRIFVLYLKNGNTVKKYFPEKTERGNPAFQPLIAISNMPFSGNASYFEERVKTDVNEPGFIAFSLDYANLLDKTDSDCPMTATGEARMQLMRDLTDIEKSACDKKDSTLNFPLARWLSRVAIERMNCTWDVVYRRNPSIIKLISDINKIQHFNPSGAQTSSPKDNQTTHR